MLLNRFKRLKGYGRYACLGSAVLETLGRRYKIHNMQKGRIDYIQQCLENQVATCKPDQVVHHLARDYIIPTVEQQSTLCPSFRPEVIFVDSFADLTDQLFRHKTERWTFCCNYLDLQHTQNFSDLFESQGLLDLSELFEKYVGVSRLVKHQWGDIPIVYLNFPDKLETREKFVRRAAIIRSITDACTRTIPQFYAFSVPSSIVRPPRIVEPGMENFPYHFSKETYEHFASLIRQHPKLQRLFGV
jgi:hypothetical protein